VKIASFRPLVCSIFARQTDRQSSVLLSQFHQATLLRSEGRLFAAKIHQSHQQILKFAHQTLDASCQVHRRCRQPAGAQLGVVSLRQLCLLSLSPFSPLLLLVLVSDRPPLARQEVARRAPVWPRKLGGQNKFCGELRKINTICSLLCGRPLAAAPPQFGAGPIRDKEKRPTGRLANATCQDRATRLARAKLAGRQFSAPLTRGAQKGVQAEARRGQSSGRPHAWANKLFIIFPPSERLARLARQGVSGRSSAELRTGPEVGREGKRITRPACPLESHQLGRLEEALGCERGATRCSVAKQPPSKCRASAELVQRRQKRRSRVLASGIIRPLLSCKWAGR